MKAKKKHNFWPVQEYKRERLISTRCEKNLYLEVTRIFYYLGEIIKKKKSVEHETRFGMWTREAYK